MIGVVWAVAVVLSRWLRLHGYVGGKDEEEEEEETEVRCVGELKLPGRIKLLKSFNFFDLPKILLVVLLTCSKCSCRFCS